jgi:hypothetical protein
LDSGRRRQGAHRGPSGDDVGNRIRTQALSLRADAWPCRLFSERVSTIRPGRRRVGSMAVVGPFSSASGSHPVQPVGAVMAECRRRPVRDRGYGLVGSISRSLLENDHDDTAVLGPSRARFIGRHRVVLTVGDGRHPVQSHALLAEIATHRLGAVGAKAKVLLG